MPFPTNSIPQSEIMKAMKAIGYEVNPMGMCFGISTMAEQAFLIGQMDKYVARIEKIAQNSNDIKRYLDGLSKEERTDILAFFDGVALYQSPDSELQREILLGPDVAKTAPVLQNERLAKPLIQSQALQSTGQSMEHLPLIRSEYDSAKLKQQLTMICEQFSNQKFAISVDCANHQMTLHVDQTTSPVSLHWFDPNGMQLQVEADLAAGDLDQQIDAVVSHWQHSIQFARESGGGSKENKSVPFALSIATLDKSAAEASIARLNQNQDWQQLYSVENVNNYSDLFFHAFFNEDMETCQAIHQHIVGQGASFEAVIGSKFDINDIYQHESIKEVREKWQDPEPSSEKDKQQQAAETSSEEQKITVSAEQALATVKLNGLAIKYLPDDLQNDPAIVEAAVRQNGYVFAHLSESFKANKELATLAVNTDGRLLRYASDALKSDKSFVQSAISSHVDAFNFADKSLREDVDILQDVYNKSKTTFFKSAKLNLGNISALFRRDGFKVERLEDMIKFSEALSNPQDKSTFFNTYKTKFQLLIDNCHDINAQLNSLQNCCPFEENVVDLYSYLLSGLDPILEMDPSLFGNIIYTLPTDNAKNEFFKLCQDTLIEKMAPRNLTSLSNVPDKALRDGFVEVYFSKHKEQIVAEVVDSDYLEYALSNIPEVIREAAFQESVQGLSQKLIENDDLGKKLASYPEKYKLQLFERIMPEISNDENKLLSLVTNLHGELQHRAFEQYMGVANDPTLLLAHASCLDDQQRGVLYQACAKSASNIDTFLSDIQKVDVSAKSKARASLIIALQKENPALLSSTEAVKRTNDLLYGTKEPLNLPSTKLEVEQEKLKLILAMKYKPKVEIVKESFKQLMIQAVKHSPDNFAPLKAYYETFLESKLKTSFADLGIAKLVQAMARQADISAAMPVEAGAGASPLEQEEHHVNEQHQAEPEATAAEPLPPSSLSPL